MTVASINDFPAESYNGVNQQPEKNAANWFKETFVDNGDGAFISLSEMAAGISVSDYSTLWVNVDRMGLSDLAAAGITDAIIEKIADFVKAGGNLYLTKQANMIAYKMGRMGYAPGWSNGGYSDGGDTWTINAQLGLWPGIGHAPYDRRNHPVFDYVDVATDINSYIYEEVEYNYETMPLVGAVARSDNNNMWIDMFRRDPNTGGKMEETEGYTHYKNDNYLRLEDFEADWNCVALAVWGQVTDFCAAGIIEFKPQGEFKGGILTNGFAAYQWGTSNDNLDNVKQLTESSLVFLEDYTPTAVEESKADTPKAKVQGIFDLIGKPVSESQMVPGNVYIVNGEKVLYSK